MNTFIGIVFMVLACWMALGCLLSPLLVGKERKPWTAGQIIANLVSGLITIAALVIAAFTMFGGGL